jgi:hypothetical protein
MGDGHYAAVGDNHHSYLCEELGYKGDDLIDVHNPGSVVAGNKSYQEGE